MALVRFMFVGSCMTSFVMNPAKRSHEQNYSWLIVLVGYKNRRYGYKSGDFPKTVGDQIYFIYVTVL